MLHLGINVGLLTSSPINGHWASLQFEMSLGPQDYLHAQLFGERIHGLHIHCIYTKVYFLKMIISAREKTPVESGEICFLSLCPFRLRTCMKPAPFPAATTREPVHRFCPRSPVRCSALRVSVGGRSCEHPLPSR